MFRTGTGGHATGEPLLRHPAGWLAGRSQLDWRPRHAIVRNNLLRPLNSMRANLINEQICCRRQIEATQMRVLQPAGDVWFVPAAGAQQVASRRTMQIRRPKSPNGGGWKLPGPSHNRVGRRNRLRHDAEVAGHLLRAPRPAV